MKQRITIMELWFIYKSFKSTHSYYISMWKTPGLMGSEKLQRIIKFTSLISVINKEISKHRVIISVE